MHEKQRIFFRDTAAGWCTSIFFHKKCGQATISFILLIGGIIMEVAIAGALVVYFMGNAGVNERFSLRAHTAANVGLRNAQLRIMRNKNFLSIKNAFFNFSLPVGNYGDYASTTIILTDNIGESYVYTIIAQGNAAGRIHTFQETLFVDTVTGLVRVQSLREESLP